jgi:hypothetical protein
MMNIDIYAINPLGGPVNINTHIPAITPRADILAAHRPDLPPPLVTLSVCSRIKHVTGITKHEDGTMKVHHLHTSIGSTSCFVGTAPLNEQLYVVSQSGLLTLYQLQPHPPPPNTEVDPSSLQLSVMPLSEWDVARRPRWPECRQSSLFLKGAICRFIFIICNNYPHRKRLRSARNV